MRSLVDEDRNLLLDINQKLSLIAAGLDGEGGLGAEIRVEDHGFDWRRYDRVKLGAEPAREAPLRLPEPQHLRRIIHNRRLREHSFGSGLFADPAWDMLLDLMAAHQEQKSVSVTSLCIASGVPTTTALRWIAMMVDAGLVLRIDDVHDRRRTNVQLSAAAVKAMVGFFEKAEKSFENKCYIY